MAKATMFDKEARPKPQQRDQSIDEALADTTPGGKAWAFGTPPPPTGQKAPPILSRGPSKARGGLSPQALAQSQKAGSMAATTAAGLTGGFSDNFDSGGLGGTSTSASSAANPSQDDGVGEGQLGALFEQLKARAAAQGVSLVTMLDNWVTSNPAMAAALGVTTGAALLALIGATVKKKTTTKKKATTKKKSSGSRAKKTTTKKKASGRRKGKKFSSTEVKRVSREARRLQHDHPSWSYNKCLKAAWADERGPTVPKGGKRKRK